MEARSVCVISQKALFLIIFHEKNLDNAWIILYYLHFSYKSRRFRERFFSAELVPV